jgi:hypothetical protein
LLEGCSAALSVTEPNGGDQLVMQFFECDAHLAIRRDQRLFDKGAHRRSHVRRKIGRQRLLRGSPIPGFRDKGVVDTGIDIIERYQTLSL